MLPEAVEVVAVRVPAIGVHLHEPHAGFDQPPRDFVLGQRLPVLDAAFGDEVDAVGLAPHHVPRDVVGDDPVGALGDLLGDAQFDHALGLGREADQQTWTQGTSAQLREDVARRHELELRRPFALLQLVR